ncbi:MAG: DUF86 domain-containing protein [Deltaproteobacteria bacterium]|nr:DUF86 domain-containing protein [Deltaproteobacteria bacterium]
MTPLPIEQETVLVRLNGIQGEIAELTQLAQTPLEQFAKGNDFKLAQYHLHRALEGVFHIAAHLLSRLPGGYAGGTYKEMTRLLGEKKILPAEFADTVLCKMAGYRNRLVHFYAEISPAELHGILQHHLPDIETFLRHVKGVLADPARFGFSS